MNTNRQTVASLLLAFLLVLALIGVPNSGHADSAGTAIGWGSTDWFHLNVPRNLTNAVMVAVGQGHGLALNGDGTLSGWSNGNDFGAGTPPAGLSNVVAIAAGSVHSVALRADGSVTAWGDNYNGQLNSPPLLANIVTIAAGGYHGLALTTNGQVLGWGGYYLTPNPASVPADLMSAIAVGAGKHHSLAVRPDGTVRAWGDNTYGQCNVPPGLTGVVAVAGGVTHSVALREDGTVVTWGAADMTNTPPGLSNVVAIAVGVEAFHTLALRADGTVVGWGSDLFGPLDGPAPYTNLTGIACGYGMSFGITREPVLLTQPVGTTVLAGTNVSFTIGVEGAFGCAYQWFFNQTNAFNAAAATLTLTNVQVADSGSYSVLLSNQYGVIASAPAALVVSPYPPAITAQPTNQARLVGTVATFQVSAVGAGPLNYQWFFNGGALTGATTAVLTLTNLSEADEGNYRVKISNAYGSINSGTASLTVNYPPAVTNLPVSLELPAGTNWILRGGATGDPPLSYQWQFQNANLPGATNRSLLLTNLQSADAGQYGIVVSNAFGKATNLVYTLTVLDSQPVIFQQPASQLVLPGGVVALRVLAYGTAPMSYQWWHDSTVVPGATNATLILTNAQASDAGAYFVGLTNAFGFTNSATAALAIGDPYNSQVDPPTLTFTRIIPNVFTNPLCLTVAGDGSGRLFVVERKGRVWFVQGTNVSAQPFLDITNRVLQNQFNIDQGLLGLAFPPGFATNQHFYVDYTRRSDSALVLSRFLLTTNANVADTNSEQVLLTIPQPFFNNKGGQVAFGKDGYLYFGTGDGGYSSTGDPYLNAQNSASLLGKLLRLDVESGTSPYGIPASNPFVGSTNAAPEIWALGLRNPRHFSFDRATGDLYLGDVGFSRYEEVDFQPAGSPGGQNYGWRVMEGPATYIVPPGFDLSTLTAPVMSYSHGWAAAAVVGGYVYRGPYEPRMNGTYFLGDYCTKVIRGLKPARTNWLSFTVATVTNTIGAFGEDEQGNLYLADYNGGGIYRMADSHAALAPQMSPNGGTFNNDQLVTITSPTPGATLHYTTDGRDPSDLDAVVPPDGRLLLTATMTFKVRACRDDLAPSAVAAASFLFQVATPAFIPGSGPITNQTLFSITSATVGATLCYTTNGVDPSLSASIYSSPFLVNGKTTVAAKGFKPGYSDSSIRSTFFDLAVTPAPEISPAGGAITNGTLVTLTCSLPNAEIHYTTDGSQPTLASPRYTAPFPVLGSSTLQAAAWVANYAPSPVTTVGYALLAYQPTVVTTYAGQLQSGLVNGPALAAMFNAPKGVCVDRAGNLFVADTGNNVIREVLTNGQVIAFAGSGQPGTDDGLGTNATFTSPTGVALDSVGNLLVVDSGNNLLRMITPGRMVTTKANLADSPNQLPVLWQLAVAPDNTAYVSGWLQVFQVNPSGTFSSFAGPGWCCPPDWSPNIGLAINPQGGLFATINSSVTATYGRVVRLSSSGGYDIYAGNVSGYTDGPRLVAQFQQPMALALEPDGGLLVSDWTRIRRIDASGFVTTLAGSGEAAYRDGPGVQAAFNQLGAVAVDSAGNIYVADSGNNCIRKLWADSFGVGIPDAWQVAHFGHSGIDPHADPDGDGLTNLQEYQLGLDPLLANRPYLYALPSGTNRTLAVRMEGLYGRAARVEVSSNLIQWETLTNLSAGSGADSFEDSGAAQRPERFYRLVLP